MIATIAKQFTFDAAHRLPECPPDHKCFRLHGHTYTVEVVLVGPVDERTGFVVDYDHIAKAWEPIGAVLDHSYLNDHPGLECPSTEVLAAWIAKRLVASELLVGVPAPPLDPDPYALSPGEGPHSVQRPTTLVTKVRVCESSSTWCEVEVGGRYGVQCIRTPWEMT